MHKFLIVVVLILPVDEDKVGGDASPEQMEYEAQSPSPLTEHVQGVAH